MLNFVLQIERVRRQQFVSGQFSYSRFFWRNRSLGET